MAGPVPTEQSLQLHLSHPLNHGETEHSANPDSRSLTVESGFKPTTASRMFLTPARKCLAKSKCLVRSILKGIAVWLASVSADRTRIVSN